VKSLASKRSSSEDAIREFQPQNVGARSPAAIEQVRAERTYESKSVVFALASYYLTMVKYDGNNEEFRSKTSYDAVGGTGRIGLGTWFKEESRMGLLGVVDMSGFSIGDQTFTYLSGAVEGVYRHRLGAVGQLRGVLGAQYRELPVTIGRIGSSNTTNFEQQKIANLGPLLGVSLTHAFYQKLGVQVNAQMFYGATTMNSPGAGGKPTTSYQVGFLGSLKLSERLIGLAGYAYRVESAQYSPSSGSGSFSVNPDAVNNITISGHYINLMMEYGF